MCSDSRAPSDSVPAARQDPQKAPVAPSAAAALIIARPAARAPEILLLKRSPAASFVPNAYVFPGGAVDVDDATEQIYGLCAGITDATASEQLDLPRNGLQFFVAAVREAFEECGLLYAYDAQGRVADLTQWETQHLNRLRTELECPGSGLAQLCASQSWRLAVDRLIYFGHWITPLAAPRRFDTRFFIACAPSLQLASLASDEMAGLIWVTATDALAKHAAGGLKLLLPTRTLLAEVAPFDTIDALFESARMPRKIRTIMLTLPAH
jgi:8-oxo-dGTP pyrophosphatase MutT (NUDIX family)